MEASSKICFVLLGSFFSSHILECKKLVGYEFPVYSTEFCPRNQTEWNERSSAISCNETNGYVCLPNENITELLEFCYIDPFIWIQKGICLYLIKRYSRVNSKTCKHFRFGCPNSSHQSLRNFLYPSCLAIGKGCFLAEPSCNSTTTNFQDTTEPPQTENYTIKHRDSIAAACYNNRIDSVLVLLASFSGVILASVVCNIGHKKGHLFICCRRKFHFKKIERHDSNRLHLTSNKEAINLCTENEATPLQFACEKGLDNTVQLLLDNGADINLCTENGTTPLHFACENGHCIVQLLLSNEANINSRNKNGSTPLHFACKNGHLSIVQHLLSNEVDIDLCNKNGATPLHFACENGHDSIVQLLLSNGANIHSRTENGETPLHRACEKGHNSTVKLLLSKGADINLCNKTGATPLHFACENGHDCTEQLLLKNGADINLRTENGTTPLLFASENRHDSIVHLLSNGADVDECN